MTWAIRSCALAVGAAALLSTQAVYAAPVSTRSTGVDPLVSLSVLGSTESRGAVCSGATFGTDAAAACGVPVSVAAASAAAVAAQGDAPPKSIGPIALVAGLIVIAAVLALILAGNNDAEGDLTPVSPG